jgi:transcriptional regulator with XRE-family HTH domain
MSRGTFDAAEFYADLDAERESRKKTWKQVAREAGISASTLTRMAQGKRPDVDSLAALVSWSGLRADDYMVRAEGAPDAADTITQVAGYLRADTNLSPEAADAIEKVLRATYNVLAKGTTNDAQASAKEGIQD